MQSTFNTYKEAPSNIAIVKYWGKKDIQKPLNPSISFTLSQAVTKTKLEYFEGDKDLSLDFLFEGQNKGSFIPKLKTFISNIKHLLPFLNQGHLRIDSSNTFPHSSGIASSASSMASLAKGLVDIYEKLGHSHNNRNLLESEIARLGSGSACRSTQLGWTLWGSTPLLPNSSDQYGVLINDTIDPLFNSLQDSILVIRKGTKTVSSTLGHSLMNNHPYQQGRIRQANSNTEKLLKALNEGDFNSFAEICEEEALSLHGLMMSSSPGYTLMAPESLKAINRIKRFRDDQNIPITYTLDAGPNIHIIYPKEQSELVVPFIEENLLELCEDNTVLYDQISMPTTNI